MPILPWIAAAFNIGSTIFDRSRAGYETSPQKRAFRDSVRNEQRIFERDAAYNSPAAQMARFKEAGLNPNLMYGQGNPGNVSGSAQTASGNVQPLDIVGHLMESAMFGKELDLKDAQIEQIRAQTKFVLERTGSEEWKQKLNEQQWNYLEQNFPEVLDKMRRENRIGTATEESQIQTSQRNAIHASQMIETELLRQHLMESDGKIRNEVLKGKQLQNAIMDMQKKFVEGGEMNATHFWQALMMILSKSF